MWFLLLAVVTSACFFYGVIKGEYLTDYRVVANLGRDEFTTPSIINNVIVNESILDDIVNSILGFFRILLPVEVIFIGDFRYKLFFLYWMFVLFYVRFVASRIDREASMKLYAVFFSYLIVCSFFEPDFGSFLKHSVALIPFILGALAYSRGRYESSSCY
jgi:hypothetical protein